MANAKRREQPLPRANPSGEKVWVARFTDPRTGARRSAGTFKRKRDAQDAIDRAYEQPAAPETVGEYFARWPELHPRAERTQRTNEHRVTRALDIVVEGRALRNWNYRELRRRHALAVIDALLREQGRSARGATHIVRALGLMSEDAITDEVADLNPFRGVRVRGNDPRVTKRPRPVRVFTFEQMHAFAAAGARARDTERIKPTQLERWRGAYAEAMLRCFSDCGLRLGEVLPLRRGDLADGILQIRRTAHEGVILPGTKTDHGEPDAGRDVPCPPTLLALIAELPARIDTDLLFPTPTGKLWRERNFYRDVWEPARAESGLDVRPHEMRHSWLTQLRAAGVDDADLAQMAGHTVSTMLEHYTHALGRSFARVQALVG